MRAVWDLKAHRKERGGGGITVDVDGRNCKGCLPRIQLVASQTWMFAVEEGGPGVVKDTNSKHRT